MPVFGSPFAGVANNRKLTDAELIRAIRFTMAAESEATQLYMQLAESSDQSHLTWRVSPLEFIGLIPHFLYIIVV